MLTSENSVLGFPFQEFLNISIFFIIEKIFSEHDDVPKQAKQVEPLH